MAANENVTNEQYQHLVDEIHNLQQAMDRRFPAEVGSRGIIGDIYELFNQELLILARQEAGETDTPELNALISDTQSSRANLVPFLRANATFVDPTLSTDFEFPEAGSGEC